MGYSPTLEALIEKFRSLPGIGGKTAVRLAFFMLNSSDDYVKDFADCITEAKSKTRTCKICQSLADDDICAVCSDETRDRSLVCVVENAKDIATFEKVKEYNGVYHVLHGAMSPMDGIGPDDIRIKELLARINGAVLCETPPGEEIAKVKVQEVILATSSNVEGEATAMYISQLVKPFGVAASRLAYGLPVGGELEYADSVTLFKALEGRREM
jgi:recombination protein RecR